MQFTVASPVAAVVAAVAVLMALAGPAAAAEDLELLVANTITKCAQAHGISAAQVIGLRLTEDKTTVHPSRPLKCFTKCVIEETGVVRDGAVDVERAVAASVAQGNDAKKARTSTEKCKGLYRAEKNGCSDMWKLYVCFHS